MTTLYRDDAAKLGQWDWSPGFEMSRMEPSAPERMPAGSARTCRS
jgi:hypothetical protein